MRTLGLLLTLLAATPQAATDQKLVVPEGTIITAAQVTGFDADRLSPDLRQDILNLAGTPLKQQRLDELAARIEAERPRYVAAVRRVMDPGGEARVFFVVGRQAEPDRDDNINARYIVEQADISGVLGAQGRDLPFWVRLEYRILDGDGVQDPADAGYTLQALIDALSRRRKTDSSSHALEAGPFRIRQRGSSLSR